MENKEKKSKILGLFIFGTIIVLSIAMISAIILELTCDGNANPWCLPIPTIIIGALVAVLIIIKMIKAKEYKKKLKLLIWLGVVILITWIVYYFIYVLISINMANMATSGELAKPVIYLYPEEETEVNVKLGNEENITCSYPKYKTGGWNIIAKPNGDLIDLDTGRKLYSLYWEGINTLNSRIDEGFVVKGEDTSKFLEEKLEILGLNYKEIEEFIIYWLPKLESNKYNYIRFQDEEEINQNMPLEITPMPDTVIRVVMEWKGLDKYIEIPEQELITPKRNGFTVVEWGGTEIK